jgi:mediator of RNA polymerase II transcription subunit 1
MVSLYSAISHSSDSVLGVTLNNTTAHLNAVRKPNNDVSLKSDSIDMDVSVIEPVADGNQIIAEDADSLSSNDAVAALLNVTKSKESSSPKNKSAYPSVSITPVNSLHTSSLATTYPNINLERRPGIEIIPFSKDSPSSSIPSSLTITPVGGKPTKDKSKYKDFRLKEGLTLDSETKDRDREKERERKERKRRREGEKSPSSGGSGGKPTKMMNLSATLMGPPGALLKMDSSPKLNHKNSSSGSNNISTPPSNASLSPLTSPSKSSSKSSTPSSSPKHPSSGGKPSMSALSMSALKCK